MRASWIAFALSMTMTTAMAGNSQDAPAKDMIPLQGTWVMTEINGVSAPGDTALVIAGSKYSETVDGSVDETGTLKVDASKTPMTVDLLIQEGEAAGKTQLGVFDVKGETLRLLLNTAGDKVRPTSLDKGDGELFIIAQKMK